MNRDPLDTLDQYYVSLQAAELPPSLTSSNRRFYAWIPISGLAFGLCLAFGVALIPDAPTKPSARGIARSIAERQMPTEKPTPQRRGEKGAKTWGA